MARVIMTITLEGFAPEDEPGGLFEPESADSGSEEDKRLSVIRSAAKYLAGLEANYAPGPAPAPAPVPEPAAPKPAPGWAHKKGWKA